MHIRVIEAYIDNNYNMALKGALFPLKKRAL